jgi:hypothetical protein
MVNRNLEHPCTHFVRCCTLNSLHDMGPEDRPAF